MVRIRLRRMGAKKKPTYRIVVANKQSPRDGRFIETIGTYNPRTEPETVTLKADRAAHWLSVGAQPSDAVGRLLRKANLLGEDGKPIPFIEEAVAEVEPEADSTEVVAETVEDAAEEASELIAEAEAVVESVAEVTKEDA